MFRLYTILVFILFAVNLFGQATLSGVVTNEEGKAVENVIVKLVKSKTQVITNKQGHYSISVPADKTVKVRYNIASYESQSFTINTKNGQNIKNVILKSIQLDPYETTDKKLDLGTTVTLNPVNPDNLPTPSGNFEAVLPFLTFANSNNELSSGYNVRGGNFDENLIYVNGIEIYRPFLGRQGQQEGLSFINSKLIDNIKFSAGGFDAKYGDKLSSVLDITYKEPVQFAASASLSLLGGDFHIEDISENKKFSHITGVRYRNNSYLLGSLETEGEYNPIFADIQSNLTYRFNNRTSLSFLGSFAFNRYEVIPQNRQTTFGTINEAIQINIFFDGQEYTRYQTALGALTLKHHITENHDIKITTSSFTTYQEEYFDVEGFYRIGELENDISSENFGEIRRQLGVGAYLNHARNELYATVNTFNINGQIKSDNLNENRSSTFLYGVSAAIETFDDRVSEWSTRDSSGFLLPNRIDSVGGSNPYPQGTINLEGTIRQKHDLTNNRYQAYIQNTWTFVNSKKGDFKYTYLKGNTKKKEYDNYEKYSALYLTAGARMHYWDYNNQTSISPRVSLTYKPAWFIKRDTNDIERRDVTFRFASGLYYQPPFYREYRDYDAILNPEIENPGSVHFILGADYGLKFWDRDFFWTTEVYYKHIFDLITYDIDNVRIRYYAENNATGFAYGLDTKLNGEFIPGTQSYLRLSYLNTKENIDGNQYIEYFNSDGDLIVPGFTSNTAITDSVVNEVGNIRRPTDQHVTFAMFFQDRMPSHLNTKKTRWDTYTVHLLLTFGSRIPYGTRAARSRPVILKSPPYRRVDIGFGKEFIREGDTIQPKSKFFRGFKQLKLSLEVFNLLGINNVISYQYITDVNNRTYAVPNFLTNRRFNLKLTARF